MSWIVVLAAAILFEAVMAYRMRVMARRKPARGRLLALVVLECSLWAILIRSIVLDVALVPYYAAGAVVGVMIASYIGVE